MDSSFICVPEIPEIYLTHFAHVTFKVFFKKISIRNVPSTKVNT